MRNEQGFSENYREVIREDKVKTDGQHHTRQGVQAPDYCFRTGGTRKFFVEAKKPAVNIKENSEPAYQVRRYAYTAKLPLSILTDFEEFAVYDTRIKPDKNDKASTARIFYCTFQEYEQHFDFIYNTFSKNAILKGSFDRYVEENKNKKGTTPIDEDLLVFVEDWRVELAKNIALRNADISIYNLNTLVQKIIDRMLFLRIAESKGIEDADLLKTVSACQNVYKHLNQLFINANIKYNSGLFQPETWMEQAAIDDKILSNIIVNLYYPDCPYEFAVLPVEILGNIYEKFLGKTIRFKGVKGKADGVRQHSAVIEEKPEVRKAGGVYYTPQYIVDYIVQNTVGVLINGKTPEEIAALRFVDPACGSGSFLVGAYQYLLNYHLDYYSNEKNRKAAIKKEKIYEAAHHVYKLTIAQKQQILQNNIYGVDIDSQAVEVTKLSLYLKLLENEGNEAGGQLEFDMALLPSLEDNIKCGNSLIGTDFYTQGDLGLTDEEQFKVNCFDWEKEFPDVFSSRMSANKEKNLTTKDTKITKEEKGGGFDAVIGNPPYVLVFEESNKKYIEEKYPQFQRNNDLYVAFIIKAISLLKQQGAFSFITPNTYLKGDYFKALRTFLIQYKINEVVDFGIKSVFKAANVFTAITNVSKEKPAQKWVLKSDMDVVRGKINSSSDIFALENSLITKLNQYTKFDDVLIIKDVGYNYWSEGRGKVRGDSIGSRVLYAGAKENDKDIPYYKGVNIQKYILSKPSQYLRHNYNKFLKENDTFRFTPELLETKPKIIYRQTSSSLIGAMDTEGYHNDKTVHLILLKDSIKVDLRYVLALFNSRLLNYCYQTATEEQGRAFAQVKTVNVKKLPFVLPDKTAHDKLVALVDKMLELKRKEHDEPNPQVKTVIGRQIGAVDRQIDEAVYRLYGLTDEEIKAVEGEG
ncbi:adenine methyltransferase [Spirochaetia bacterium]|nr:adenine methyltransferase [Spirochaetia bacterium]